MGRDHCGGMQPFPPFPGWVEGAPVIPEQYWDVISPEQRVKTISEWLKKIVDFLNDETTPQINLFLEDVEKLQAQFDRFVESGFYDYYVDQLKDWINENVPWFFERFGKQVFFGLTDDGYFCAYVPDSWGDIQFDTGAVYGRSDYGRLILKFEPNPNAHGVIDNTYSNYTLNAKQQTMQQLIADLESTTRRSDATYNAMFSNLDVEVNNGNF